MKIYIRYLIFAIILIFVDQVVGSVISYYAQKQWRDNRIGLLIEGKTNHEICIIGSSRALNNYNPAILKDSLNLSCFNFGLSGSNVIYHEALIDIILTSDEKPKAIIYSVDDYATFYHITNIVFRKDVLYPFVYNETVNKILCEQLNKNIIATKLSKSYRQNINLINALKFPIYGQEIEDYKTNKLDSNGANLLVMRPSDPKAIFREQTINVSKMQINKDYWSAFKRIQDKCKANNIKLVFVLPPIYTTRMPGFYDLLQSAVLYNFPVFDYTYDLTDSEYFFNSDHLNINGANEFTSRLAGDLKQLNL